MPVIAPPAPTGALRRPSAAYRLVVLASLCAGLWACDSPTGPAIAGEPPHTEAPPSIPAQIEAIQLQQTIRTDPEIIDLGDIPANKPSERQVKLYNKGKQPVTFTRVSASCGCLSGEVETREIKPGDFATLKVVWTAAGHNAAKSTKTLYVMADRAPAPLQIPVSAAVVGGVEPGSEVPLTPAPAIPPLTVQTEPREVDLGYLRPEQVGRQTLTIRNTGDAPVELVRVSSNCTCAVGTLSKNTIAPGETATVDVELTAGPNIGLLAREVQVWGKDNPTPIKVAVKANVSYDVSADPMFVNMLAERKGEIALKSIDGKPFRVLSTNGEPPLLGEGDAGLSALEHTVRWDFTDVANEKLPRWFILVTDHQTMPLLDLRVIHPALFQPPPKPDPWTSTQDRLLLGRVRPGDSFEREVTLHKLAKDAAVTVAGDDVIAAELIEQSSTSRGVNLKIRITPAAGVVSANKTPGALLRGVVTISTAEPAHQAKIEVFATPETSR